MTQKHCIARVSVRLCSRNAGVDSLSEFLQREQQALERERSSQSSSSSHRSSPMRRVPTPAGALDRQQPSPLSPTGGSAGAGAGASTLLYFLLESVVLVYSALFVRALLFGDMRALYYLLRCSLNDAFVYAVLGGGYRLRPPPLLLQDSSSSSQLSHSADQINRTSPRGETCYAYTSTLKTSIYSLYLDTIISRVDPNLWKFG